MQCDYCGVVLDVNAAACPRCGKSVRDMDDKERADSSGIERSEREPGNTYYVVDGEQQEKGPYTLTQITRMWDTGALTADAKLRPSTSETLLLASEFIVEHTQARATMKGVFAGGGIVLGCIVGYFAAHYFPLWGGLAMLGEAHSQARDSLVPGHIALCAVTFGAFAFGIAHLKNAKTAGMAAVFLIAAIAGFALMKNPKGFNRFAANQSALPTKAKLREKVVPYSVQHGGRQRISPKRLIEITGKPQREQRIDDQVYWYFDCRDGTVQLVLDGDALWQGWAFITSINEY
jgi:hypothetical protein